MPAELGFPRTAVTGSYAGAYAVLHAIDQPHNLIPSLHIVYSGLIALTLAESAISLLRVGYLVWLAAITVSLPLVHQHHLADIASGYLMVWLCRHLVSDPTSRATSSPPTSQPGVTS